MKVIKACTNILSYTDQLVSSCTPFHLDKQFVFSIRKKKNVKERKITHKLEPFCALKFWHDHYIALVVGLHNIYGLEKSLTA